MQWQGILWIKQELNEPYFLYNISKLKETTKNDRNIAQTFEHFTCLFCTLVETLL